MPYFNISREKYPHEMFLMKNHMDKMVIAYAYDERNTIPHCQLIFQKGFDNIYMLSGGIEEFVKNFPDFCEGPGMTKVLHEIKQKEMLEKEQMSKSRYKNNTKSVVGGEGVSGITNKIGTMSIKSQKGDNMIVSSKTSTVSGYQQQQQPYSEKAEFTKLKNDLTKK